MFYLPPVIPAFWRWTQGGSGILGQPGLLSQDHVSENQKLYIYFSKEASSTLAPLF